MTLKITKSRKIHNTTTYVQGPMLVYFLAIKTTFHQIIGEFFKPVQTILCTNCSISSQNFLQKT
jgi:hypothetical protein